MKRLALVFFLLTACHARPVAPVSVPQAMTARLTPPADALNPDVTAATIKSTICVKGWTATIRPPASYTTALKIKQIADRHLADTNTRDYEEDHAVSLEAGGNPTNPANLFPEVLTIAKPDDKVENQTKADICAGRITLAQGQARLWALKKAHGL